MKQGKAKLQQGADVREELNIEGNVHIVEGDELDAAKGGSVAPLLLQGKGKSTSNIKSRSAYLFQAQIDDAAVSYTHLTLPTKVYV